MRKRDVEPVKRKGGWPKGKKRGPRKASQSMLIEARDQGYEVCADRLKLVEKDNEILRVKYNCLKDLLKDIYALKADVKVEWTKEN